jgi:hypothetical protein
MPTPTYTALATVTLGTTAASVTFSSIPATYRDLILVYNGTVNVGATTTVQFNGDTGNNYNHVQMYGVGSGSGTSVSSSNVSNLNLGYPGTSITNIIVQIMDYSATDKHKTVLSRGNNAAVLTSAHVGRWASTSALTSILFSQDQVFQSGSNFALYGVIA